ncbi:MAG TPA: hypothetical protein VF519_16890 [Mycobacteriales bacterium]
MTLGRRLSALALALAAACPAGAAASAAPPRAAEAELTTGTSIRWTGVSGIRLRVPDVAHLPDDYGALLTVRGGTFAAVRISLGGACRAVDCAGVNVSFDYTRDMARYGYRGYPPGKDHLAVVTNDGRIAAGVWQVYLFTDGVATLTFDSTGLRTRRQAVTAAGRVHGSFRRLAVTCGYDHCTTSNGYAGRVWTGGGYGDVGRYGSADGFVAYYQTSDEYVPEQVGMRGCGYQARPEDTGDPAKDHPLGCDPLDDDGQSYWPSRYTATGLPLYTMVLWGLGRDGMHGRAYLGWHAHTAHDLAKPVLEAWGVWFEYGVT